MTEHQQNRGVVRTLINNSFLLIAGAVAALLWANLAPPISTTSGPDAQASDALPETSYTRFVNFDLSSLWSDHKDEQPTTPDDDAAQAHEEEHGSHHGLTIHFVINDILMALFFAIAAKEVWESLLPGGALSKPRKAATPLLATVGGIIGPALIYLAGCYFTNTQHIFGTGWAVPCATDIAFSYLIARMIFGAGHPAIAFLLLLAIADDAAGLMLLAVLYPQDAIQPQWFLLTAGAMGLAYCLQKGKIQSHWIYLLGPGILSWYSFYQANIHAALGLVPIIPMLPHAHTDLGLFARAEQNRKDTLNEFEHFWKTPVEYFLGLFGLANAGVVMSSLGTGTWLVLGGLLLGKPLGITAMTLVAEKGLKLEKPAGMDYRHIVTLGMVAGIGFTVALFVSVAAFPDAGPVQDSVKMGALLSFAAAPLAIVIGKGLGIRPDPKPSTESVAEVSNASNDPASA